MASAHYLYRRDSGVYFVRLCVPARLKAAVGKGEVHRTTGCRDYRLAKIVAAELSADWHRAIRSVERMDVTKITAGSLRLLGEGFISLDSAASELGTTAAILAAELVLIDAPFSIEAKKWQGWLVDNIYEALDHGFDDFGQQEIVIDQQRLGGRAAQGSYTGRLGFRFTKEAVDAAQGATGAGVCQFSIWPSKDRFLVCEPPGRSIQPGDLQVRKSDVERLRSGLATRVTPEMLEAVGNRPLEPGQPKAPAKRFSAFAEEYLQRNDGLWKNDQHRRRRDQCAAFAQLMGDPLLSAVDRQMMRAFGDRLAQVPDERHNVRRRFNEDADFVELIALADAHNLPRLTVQAQRRMLDGMSEIFTWAVKETWMAANPAIGLGSQLEQKSGAKKVKVHEQREAMNTDDLAQIFSAPWYVTGRGVRTARGDYFSYRPYYYWMPLLGLHVGGRLNELAQLYLTDIRTDADGIHFIDFNLDGDDKLSLDDEDTPSRSGSDKSLKTVNASRSIPIHKFLIERGFLEYVAALRDAGFSRLFPEVKFDQHKGYGKAIGKWFNERYLGNRLGIKRNGKKTFHSLRHNYATAMGVADIPTNVKSDLMGHARSQSLVEARYDKGRSLVALKKHVDEITFELPVISHFDIEEGLAAIGDALALKKRHSAR